MDLKLQLSGSAVFSIVKMIIVCRSNKGIQTQFVVVVAHMANVMIRFPDCSYPSPFKVIIACYGLLFYYLFAGFWKKAYNSKKKGQKAL